MATFLTRKGNLYTIDSMIDDTNDVDVFDFSQFSRPSWDKLGLVVSPFSIEADPRYPKFPIW